MSRPEVLFRHSGRGRKRRTAYLKLLLNVQVRLLQAQIQGALLLQRVLDSLPVVTTELPIATHVTNNQDDARQLGEEPADKEGDDQWH